MTIDNKQLLQYLVGAIAVYLVLKWCQDGKLMEGMRGVNPADRWHAPMYGYPATYPGFYKYKHLDIMNDYDKCLVPFNVDKDCVNRRLMDTGGDVGASIALCQHPEKEADYVAMTKNHMRRKLMTGYPDTMHVMPLTVPTVSQVVPTYDFMGTRKY